MTCSMSRTSGSCSAGAPSKDTTRGDEGSKLMARPSLGEPRSPSALPDLARRQPPELEVRGTRRHDRVLGGKLPQRLLVVGLDNREAVRVLIGQDRAEHDHLTALEVRAPVRGV